MGRTFNDTELKEIQNKILEIVNYFDSFCRENEIEYYLMGGSALGAIRHQGFIPWDDDFDVFMTYDNYIKFINIASLKLDQSKFYLQEENTKEWPLFFTKLRMNNTTFIEEDTKNRKMHKGFYIDVMCLNHTFENKFLRYSHYAAARLLIANTLHKRGYITDSFKKKLFLKFSNIFITKNISNLLLKYVRVLNKNKTKYVGHFFGRAKFKNTSFESSVLGQPRLVKFENYNLPVPEKVETYLEVRYGKDFMKMPDENTKALYPSHAIFVDTNKGFEHYDNL